MSLGLRITDAVKNPAAGDRELTGQSVNREWMTREKELIKKKKNDWIRCDRGGREVYTRDQWPV